MVELIRPSGRARRRRAPALPREVPIEMPAQDLSRQPAKRRSLPADPWAIVPRTMVFGLTALIAALYIAEMYAVLAISRMTTIGVVMLVLFSISIVWIAFAFSSALTGFLALAMGRGVFVPPGGETLMPMRRTAILIPCYNESPARVFATAAATAQGLADAGAGRRFDVFVLSDSTDPDAWIAEEAAYREVSAHNTAGCAIYYRHRRENTDRKAGNIADWVRRFGGAYESFIVFDADSLMLPRSIVAMAVAMERDDAIGLLQTVPMVAGRRTLFARLQQFAGRVYGPVIAAGVAVWARDAGNYWGHNAILRTRAFASSAGLPHLPGRPPFGGHILSHDFVEAALMRRAGWKVVMAPTLEGSYEESPPSLIEVAQRDRRWCQGNLQHAKVLPARGLHWASRLHLGMGIMSYLASPVWLVFMLAGLALALQAHFIRPEYFTEEFQLFPTWPVIDYQRAIDLFVATMCILFAPKIFGLCTLAFSPALRRGVGGYIRATASVVAESIVSALLAPIMMAIQSTAVADILLGRDTGWSPQRRDDGSVPLREIVRRHRGHTLLGIALGVSAWLVSPYLLAWMSPAVAGLVLSIPLSAWTASRGAGLALRRAGLLLIPEETDEPAFMARAGALARDLDAALGGTRSGCARLAADPALLAFHRACLPPPRDTAPGAVDTALVVGLARIEAASSLEEAVRFLSSAEQRALLGDPEGLDQLALLPRRRAAE